VPLQVHYYSNRNSHLFIPDISIAPLQVHSDALPTTALILCRI